MKIFSSLMGIFAALTLSSCMELSSVITVNADGSGTIEENVLVGAQLKAMMSSFAQAPAEAGAENPTAGLNELIPDQAKAEENAKKYGEGVTVKSVEEVNLPDGRGGAKVIYSFTDITKVKYQPGQGSSQEEAAKQEPVTFTRSGNTLTVNVPQGKADPNAEKPDAEQLKQLEEMDPAQMAMMKPMLAGMRFSFVLKAPGGIASTDAAYHEGDSVTLMEMEMDKLFDNPEALKKMGTLMGGDADPKQMAEAFKGVSGVKFEDKEKVTVELK